jgi:hypothetical protein
LTKVATNRADKPVVRDGAIRALARLDGRSALPLITRLASDEHESPQVRFRAAISTIEITDGSIDELGVLAGLEPFGGWTIRGQEASDDIKSFRSALEMVAKNGKTRAVRAAARRTQQVYWPEGSIWFALSIYYYAIALCLWAYANRHSLENRKFSRPSFVALAALVVAGLPLIVAAAYDLYP